MLKRVAAITFILACTSTAWFILAHTIYSRTYESNDRLRPGVASIWGAPQTQRPPIAHFDREEPNRVDAGTHHTAVLLPIESSRIQVGLALDDRQKGLLWYSTYVVNLDGAFKFHNAAGEQRLVTFELPFPAEQAIYDGVVMEVNGRSIPITADKHGAVIAATLQTDEIATLRVAYRSQGLESWTYKLGDDVTQSRDFQLHMKTDFKKIDFPANALSPRAKREIPGGWDLDWRYSNLISGFTISMTMPERLQPGPLAGEISYFVPVSLLLFFFLIFVITTLREIDLHPMNYFFLAAAFFAFHLLLAYLVDHVSIHIAFAICSAVSGFLVVSYLRLVIGLRFAVMEAGIAQLIYLVLFSYAFFMALSRARKPRKQAVFGIFQQPASTTVLENNILV
jgi:hypothetical protein